MTKLVIQIIDGYEGEIVLRDNGCVGVYDGSHEILIDRTFWKNFVEAVNKMDKLLILI